MSRSRRSRWSYAIETLLAVAAVAAIYLWLTNSGPTVFGQ
jgi:hypothetical protein